MDFLPFVGAGALGALFVGLSIWEYGAPSRRHRRAVAEQAEAMPISDQQRRRATRALTGGRS